MTKQQFWRLCRDHDWTYMYSDDPRMYWRGRDESDALKVAVKEHPELMPTYQEWIEWANRTSPLPEPPIPAE